MTNRFFGLSRVSVFVTYGLILFILQLVAVVPSFGDMHIVILWSLFLFLTLSSASVFPLGGGVAFVIALSVALTVVPNIQMLAFSFLGIYAVLADWIAKRWYVRAVVAFLTVSAIQLIFSDNLLADSIEIVVGTLAAIGLGVGISASKRRLAHMEVEVALSKEDARGAHEEVRNDVAASLHDTVARDLAGIIITAEGLIPLTDNSESKEKLLRIERSARESLSAIRRLIAQYSSSPTQTVHDVIRTCTTMLEGNGIKLETEIPAAIDEALTSRQRLLLALAIRESTSNALKYAAPDSTVQLVMELLPLGTVTLTTTNLIGSDLGDAALCGGFGLTHLRSRIEENDGTLHAGPIDSRWLLVATIPAVPDRETAML